MVNSKVDYNKNNIIDVNSIYPNNLKNDFVVSLNDTTFNRFLTKDDDVKIIGGIGEENLNSAIKNILESNLFDQQHQLQPIITTNVGTTQLSLSWRDFIRTLKQQDVDVDNYNIWGKATSFNWVPPINLDKFVNFRDYYWDSDLHDISTPDYITIENKKISNELKLFHFNKTISDLLLNGYVVESNTNSTISVKGNNLFEDNQDIILKTSTGDYLLNRVEQSVYNSSTGISTLTLTESISTQIINVCNTELSASKDITDNTKIYVPGLDLTTVVKPGYIFAVLSNNTLSPFIVEVATSSYSSGINYITVKEQISINVDKISLSPLLLKAKFECIYKNGFNKIEQLDKDVLYKIIWAYKLNKLESSNGITHGDILAIDDYSVDFLNSGLLDTDFIDIYCFAQQTDFITTDIQTITSNTRILLQTDKFAYIFDNPSVKYKIYSKIQTSNFQQNPLTPVENDIWHNTDDDTLNYYNGSSWNIICYNFSKIYDNADNKKYNVVQNDWSNVNSWIHKSKLQTLSNKIRAQMPILEFDDYLSLSSFTKTEYKWSYRKNIDESFYPVVESPNLFELFDITKINSDDILFTYESEYSILLSPKYGNLTESLPTGSKVVFSNFNFNNGVYTVASSNFTQYESEGDGQTLLIFDEKLTSNIDFPIGCRIYPQKTKFGDDFISPYINWRYEGIKNVYSTSYNPIKSDIYQIQIGQYSDGLMNTKYGYNWQSFAPITGEIEMPMFFFHTILHQSCLIDDYQEGDIRVYINGRRQYGNFIELPAYTDDRFVGGIQFIDGLTVNYGDVILIEVGEYASNEVGKKAIVVNTPSGYELTNLTEYKKVEQIKSEVNQYPEFTVYYSLSKLPYEYSSKIFSYKENGDNTLFNSYIGRKISYRTEPTGRQYPLFNQNLLTNDNKFLVYLRPITIDEYEYCSIWKSGNNYEAFIPQKNIENEWEIPNNWYYNIYHENKLELSYIDLFTHFNSIIYGQTENGLSTDLTNAYYLDSNVNYSIGGTIKEHNGNLDLLAHCIFNSNVTIEKLINFAKSQYSISLNYIQNYFTDNINLFFNGNQSNINEIKNNIFKFVLNQYENNTNFSRWYGDSSSYSDSSNLGIKNWILTLPMMGVIPPVKPYSFIDEKLNIYGVRHHDNHRSYITISPALKEKLYSIILNNVTHAIVNITNDSTPFPSLIEENLPVNGVYVLRTNTVKKQKKLYRYNGSEWELVDLNKILLDCIVYIENKLYDISVELFNSISYDLSYNEDNELYFEKITKQFYLRAAETNLSAPLSNKYRFSTNNPFTWNYYSMIPSVLPNSNLYIQAADYRQIYQNVYGTPYPHLEPWVLQGYENKPDWWDEEYLIDNVYAIYMWENILTGTIPSGKSPPDDIKIHSYIPVVLENETMDGYEYGQLLPPYWNSSNSVTPLITRSLFDPDTGDQITSINLDFSFGQNGDFEYEWSTSIDFNYDKMIVAFKLDPMRFVSMLFGFKQYKINCLTLHEHIENIESANKLTFHGDIVNDEIIKFNGLNQWFINYNRYSGYDSSNYDFYNIWKNSEIQLAYIIPGMIDSKSLMLRSELFDITDKDYSINLKTTKKYEQKNINSIGLNLLSAPSIYLGETDKAWTIEVSTIPILKTPILFYGVQNYEATKNNNIFTISSDLLIDVDYTNSNEYILINYNNTLKLSTMLNLTPITTYGVKITINSEEYEIEFSGSEVTTIEDLIDLLNSEISGGYFDLQLGNIILNSNLPLDNISISNDTIFNVISGFVNINSQQTRDSSFNNIFIVSGNKTSKYIPSSRITIVNSTLFNGEFNVKYSSYDVSKNKTYIEVQENVSIPNNGIIVDGALSLIDDIELPDEWTTGTEVYFNSPELVNGLSLDRPYYIIRISEYQFKIATSEFNAINGNELDLSNIVINSELFVGKLIRTFKADGGNTIKINWRVHAPDYRQIKTIYDGVTFTGMQTIVDFLYGYSYFNQKQGFDVSNNYTDFENGRPYSWDNYIDKFITWAFNQRYIQQQNKLEYTISMTAEDDSINFIDSIAPNLANGSTIILLKEQGASLPTQFTTSESIYVPYYIVRTSNQNKIKLAYSAYDASKGIYIKFENDSSGKIYIQIFEKYENKPYFLFAPFREYLSMEHNIGYIGNIFENDSYVYGVDGSYLDRSSLFVSRWDNTTNITILGKIRDYNLSNPKSKYYICGAKLNLDIMQHILCFNDYTVNGNLIYDPFLGLKTSRFIVEFNKPKTNTYRPSNSGYMLNNYNLEQNIESAISDSRYYYDELISDEYKASTTLARTALGYDGPKSYMSDIAINSKSQFLFWKSMIQNKGTNLAINAFVNQKYLTNAVIDECWAYKLAEFGGVYQLEYPEMKLLAQDAVKNELRIEFVPPNTSGTGSLFEPVELTDMSRWYDQPDQLYAMRPYNSFYFSTKVKSITENAYEKLKTISGMKIFICDDFVDGAIITCKDLSGNKITLTENSDFKFLNSKIIHIEDLTLNKIDTNSLTISTLTYNNDAENCAKIIDRINGIQVCNVPFWNPALNQYDNNFTAPVDIFSVEDPAIYNVSLNGLINQDKNIWMSDQDEIIWVDINKQGYLPYFDKTIMPNVNDRIFNWGKLADWASIEVYQWTKTNIHPNEWDDIATKQVNDYTVDDSQKITGQVRKLLYKNIGTLVDHPVWVEEKDIHVDIIVGLLNSSNIPELIGNVNVYINGKFSHSTNIQDKQQILDIHNNLTIGTYLHLIKIAHVPTDEQIDANEYKYFIPHVIEYTVNHITGKSEPTYYYWVSNKQNKIKNEQKEYTLIGIKNGLMSPPTPYMIVQSLRAPGSGYGLIYGNVFDEFAYDLPYRYSQLIIKGLEGRIKDDSRYVIRFTKDFNLRDTLDNNLLKKNVHEEWKIIREKQFNKIDRYLWNKIIESVIGYKLTSYTTYDKTIPLPNYNRIVFDKIYSADTRIGLGVGQVFMDSDKIIEIINNFIQDESNNEDMSSKEYLSLFDYTTPERAITSLNNIYDGCTVEIINKLFFIILHSALSYKKEFKEFIKTSWVAIQVEQNINLNNSSNLKILHNLEPQEQCE